MSERVLENELGVPYTVFGLPGGKGGKAVRVFGDAAGDLQARAAGAGPLSVFIERCEHAEVRLRTFTPQREKGESDSGALAALSALHAAGHLPDLAEVLTPLGRTPAQLCGAEWLLSQGVATVSQPPPQLWPGFLPPVTHAHVAATARPNLLLEVATLADLDSFVPSADDLSELGRQTQTTGLVLYTRHAPAQGPQRRADVSFRCFGPLRGFLEDAASSNMFACLTGVLLQRGLTPTDTNLLRGAQRLPGQPALLSGQFGEPHEAVWVGGRAERQPQP